MSFTKIPNELMDVLMSGALNSSEQRVVLFIARKTFGYHKNIDEISYSQFEKKLGICRNTAITTTTKLVQSGLLVKKLTGRNRPNLWQIDLTNHMTKLVQLAELVQPTAPVTSAIPWNGQKKANKERLDKDSYKNPKKETLGIKNKTRLVRLKPSGMSAVKWEWAVDVYIKRGIKAIKSETGYIKTIAEDHQVLEDPWDIANVISNHYQNKN